jgi:hypothetical protein
MRLADMHCTPTGARLEQEKRPNAVKFARLGVAIGFSFFGPRPIYSIARWPCKKRADAHFYNGDERFGSKADIE